MNKIYKTDLFYNILLEVRINIVICINKASRRRVDKITFDDNDYCYSIYYNNS